MLKKWKVKVNAQGIVCAIDEEDAISNFIDGWLDYGDFELEFLGDCEE